MRIQFRGQAGQPRPHNSDALPSGQGVKDRFGGWRGVSWIPTCWAATMPQPITARDQMDGDQSIRGIPSLFYQRRGLRYFQFGGRIYRCRQLSHGKYRSTQERCCAIL